MNESKSLRADARWDGLDYVRHAYDGRAQVGRRIKFRGGNGTITGGSGQYIVVALDDEREDVILHPTWEVEYLGMLGE